MPHTRNSRERRPPPPLDAASLERLALRYVERFATTRGRLTDYLVRKIRERGWEGDRTAPEGLAEKFAELGYIDDRAFGEARAAAMARRGLGKRRVSGVLRQAGIDEEDAEALAPGIEARGLEAALTFARKRRIGPFATVAPDRPQREKQIAAMIRGGHDFTLARRIASMAPGEKIDELE
ncbi:MAG: RecX family transcriptional regulator [Candidatus Sphingomonas phytovorans]|nr:RecX family transcriptional regulator [Sphingomonas sp.]WEK01970.1 MAG: RecX family transcriptional regulator [Sphingomonas sp.]